MQPPIVVLTALSAQKPPFFQVKHSYWAELLHCDLPVRKCLLTSITAPNLSVYGSHWTYREAAPLLPREQGLVTIIFSLVLLWPSVCVRRVCVCGIGIGPASANCCRCIGQQGEISFGSLRQDLLPPSASQSGVSIFNRRLLGLYDPRHLLTKVNGIGHFSFLSFFWQIFSHYHNPYSHRGRHVPCEGGLRQTKFL